MRWYEILWLKLRIRLGWVESQAVEFHEDAGGGWHWERIGNARVMVPNAPANPNRPLERD